VPATLAPTRAVRLVRTACTRVDAKESAPVKAGKQAPIAILVTIAAVDLASGVLTSAPPILAMVCVAGTTLLVASDGVSCIRFFICRNVSDRACVRASSSYGQSICTTLMALSHAMAYCEQSHSSKDCSASKRTRMPRICTRCYLSSLYSR